MSDDFDDEALAAWEVIRDGTTTAIAIAGYTGDEQRGLVAMHFAQDDFTGWAGDQYDQILWVRRRKPEPEEEPGQALRVTVVRDHEAEREWLAKDVEGWSAR